MGGSYSQRAKSELEGAEAPSSKKAKGETAEFTAEHQASLAYTINSHMYAKILSLAHPRSSDREAVMANRTALYTTPGLEPFRAHGSSKLSAKVQQLMDVFDKANGGDDSVAKVYAKEAKTGASGGQGK